MRPRSLIATALGVLAIALACGAGAASASTYLHRGTTTGNVLAAGTPVMPRAGGPATLVLLSVGTIGCTASTGIVTVGPSGGATVAAVGDSLSFSGCTDTIPIIDFSSCTLAGPAPTATVTATGATGGTVVFVGTYAFCKVTGAPTGCYYGAIGATGTASNTGATLAYNNVSVTHEVPPGATGDLGGLCGNTGFFAVTFTDLAGGSPSATVVLNQTA